MKILSITNHSIYRNNQKYQNISFKGKTENQNFSNSDESDLLKDNFNDAYNREYVPVEYEKTPLIYSHPLVLPSMRERIDKDTFRDDELFYDDYDIKAYLGPNKYGLDDVLIPEDLWMKDLRNDRKNLSNIETNLMPDEVLNYDAMHNPWRSEQTKKEKEREINYKMKAQHEIYKVPNTKKETVKEIFNSATLLTNGKLRINPELCDLAIDLYKNSKEWSDTEKNIMKEVKVPFYQDIYVDFSRKKLTAVLNCLFVKDTNKETLEVLNKFFKGNEYNLRSIFSEEELKDLIDKIND